MTTYSESSYSSTEQLVEDAIDRSKSHDEIVHVTDASPTLVSRLEAECEGSVDANGVKEFWGEDVDGNTWRVHVDSMAEDDDSHTTIVASISDGMSRNAGGETRITADSYEDAVSEAEEWVRDGDYTSEDSDTVDVQLIIADTDDTILERRTVTAPACRA